MATRTLGLSLALAAISCAGHSDAVPVYDEPMHHLVLTTPHARVLDVRIPSAAASQQHVHAHDIFYAVVQGSDVWSQAKDGTVRRASWRAGHLSDNTSYHGAPIEHRVGNSGTTPLRLIAVENLGEPVDRPLDRGRVATLGHPEVEDARFRAYRIHLAPGVQIATHRHDRPCVLVQLCDGATRVDATSDNLERGGFRWIDAGVDHSYVNVGEQPVELVEIEIR